MRFGKKVTNQQCELLAVLRALEGVDAVAAGPYAVERVEIFSDSTYAIKCVDAWTEGWVRGGWKTAAGTPVKNRDLLELLREARARSRRHPFPVRLVWCKGHDKSGTEIARGNAQADHLARGAAEKAAGSTK